jgi:hypothetical protein
MMARLDQVSMQSPLRPSVYTLTDRQLADEYRTLTGAAVAVPSSDNAIYWRRWRSDLQLRVLEARVTRLTR